MQRVKLGQQRGDLGQERIAEDRSNLFFAAAAGIADQLADLDLEGGGQALERAERGDGFAVLDFGDIRPGYLHAAGELALAQVAGPANLTDLRCNLEAGLSTGGSGLRCDQLQQQGCWLLNIKGPVALSAERVAGAVLNQAAEIAAYNFSRLHANECGGHSLIAESQSLLSTVDALTVFGVTVGGMNHNCQVET